MISSTKSTLTVVIPALNEEQAIAATLTRCLAVSESLRLNVGLQKIEWIVVSDGSTDKTVQIARTFGAVTVIELPTNRLRLVVDNAAQVNALLATISFGTYEVVVPLADA